MMIAWLYSTIGLDNEYVHDKKKLYDKIMYNIIS